MQRNLIVAAIAGLTAAPVFAQSYMQIGGTLDAAYEHWSNDQKGVVQADGQSGFTNKTSRIILNGEEDMGSGLKAFFVLEERLNLGEGANQAQFYDRSFLGLKTVAGDVIFGYVPTVLDSIGSKSVIAGFDTLGDFGSRQAKALARSKNGLRYTSPAFGGVKLIAHYGSPEAAGVAAQYGVALSGTWGPASAEVGVQRGDVTTTGTPATVNGYWKTWLLSGAYDFGVAKVGGIYSRSNDYKWQTIANGEGRMTRYALGVTVPLSTGTLGANIGRGTERTTAGAKVEPFTHVGLTYQHNLSKRTKIVTALAYERQKDKWKNGADTRVGAELGLRHDF